MLKIVAETWHQNGSRGFVKQNVHRGLDRKNVSEAHPDKNTHRLCIGNKIQGGARKIETVWIAETVSKDEAG